MPESKSVSRTIRFPTFLDDQVNEILKTHNLPKVDNVSDIYKFFVQLGLHAFDQYKHVKNDPEKARLATEQIEFLLKQDDVVLALQRLPPNQFRGLAMAMKIMESNDK